MNTGELKQIDHSDIRKHSLNSVFSRNLSLFYFMVVHDSYKGDATKERTLWVIIGLLSRVYSLPEVEYERWKTGRAQRLLVGAAREAVSLIRRIYGDECCTYNDILRLTS